MYSILISLSLLLKTIEGAFLEIGLFLFNVGHLVHKIFDLHVWHLYIFKQGHSVFDLTLTAVCFNKSACNTLDLQLDK